MVLGIVGCVVFVIPFLGFPLSLLAIVFGLIGQRSRGKRMATAGLVTGLVCLILSIASSILWLTYPR
jgi:Na+/proline symporter